MPLQAAWALCLGGGPGLPGFSVAYTSLKLAWRKHGKTMEKPSQEVRILGLSLRILLQANGLRARTLGIKIR